MKRLKCDCGAELFFESTRCLGCQREVGFSLERQEMVVSNSGVFSGVRGPAVKCHNYSERGICNWLVEDPQHGASGAVCAGALCRSCVLTRVVPDLSVPANIYQMHEVERAKRRLIYQLVRLGLNVESTLDNPEKGLSFEVKAQVGEEPVLTGHKQGVITIRLEEADVVYREQTRATLNEKYRTMVGHCRHESGHYYFDRLIVDQNRLEEFRALFGDERADYAEALKRHYSAAPSDAWKENYITPYAASHPWEDWAETWAHYLHVSATVETALAHRLGRIAAERVGVTRVLRPEPVSAKMFGSFVTIWMELSIALNELNRSLGLPDAYPFELKPRAIEKLHMVHEVVAAQSALRTIAAE